MNFNPLIAQQPLQELDLLAELIVVGHELLDLADRMQHGVWSRLPNLRPISGSEREVSSFARYMPIWRGRTDRPVAPSRQQVAAVHTVMLRYRAQDVVDAHPPWLRPAHQIAHDLLGDLDGHLLVGELVARAQRWIAPSSSRPLSVKPLGEEGEHDVGNGEPAVSQHASVARFARILWRKS